MHLERTARCEVTVAPHEAGYFAHLCGRCSLSRVAVKGAICRPCAVGTVEPPTEAEIMTLDRPRLRMEVERLAREGAVLYLNPAIQEETDYNMLRLLYVTC